jgi:putative membrane protein
VGLILVFRNQTSYNRFWDGRNGKSTLNTCVRNLSRTIVTNSYNKLGPPTPSEREDIERTIRILVAIPFATKNHLRAEWGAAWAGGGFLGNDLNEHGDAAYNPEYASRTGRTRRRGTGITVSVDVLCGRIHQARGGEGVV